MGQKFKTTTWWILCILSIIVGIYPITYFLIDGPFGLMTTKSLELLESKIYNMIFYGHIIPGGVALLIGWSQFSSKFRNERMMLHRTIGKIYIISVLISGVCGLYIAQTATGGISNVIGFSLMGLVWLISTILGFKSIKSGNVELHKYYMIYSYAVCFSAVTLRIWLPILISITGEFISAYQIVGWLSWVPNVIVAFFIVNRLNRKFVPKIV